MNSRPELASSDRISTRRSERVEDYLDHLCAPLVGVVPYANRVALRSEAGAHIAWLVEEFEQQGQKREDAIEAALREHGEPWPIGAAWVDEWLRDAPTSALSRKLGSGWMRAFVAFGAASVLNWLLLEMCLLLPGMAALKSWLMLLAVLSPMVAGALTGAKVPARAEQVVGGVQLVLTAHAFGAAWIVWLHPEGLTFAFFQLFFWLPCGCLSAWLAASMSMHLRRSRFWRIAR